MSQKELLWYCLLRKLFLDEVRSEEKLDSCHLILMGDSWYIELICKFVILEVFDLVWFNGISTIVGYLMPNPI